MRSMLLLGLLLVAGCKIDWAGPDLSCLSPGSAEVCSAPPVDSVTTASLTDTLPVYDVQSH